MRFYIFCALKLFFILGILAGCTTVNYNPKEFETDNYQKNIDDATDVAILFNNADIGSKDVVTKTQNPMTGLSSQDFAMLMQADLYFNQENYIKAAPLYEKLSYKYKDPKIIYKAIICMGRLSPTQVQVVALNQLINLFINSAPQSSLAKLFQIRIGINTNNIKLAETNLDTLISANTNKVRAILLFVSSMISTDVRVDNNQTVNQFINYVQTKYGEYPESHLVAAIGNAAISNENGLLLELHTIYNKYPTWKIPLYWAIGVLALHKDNYAIINVVSDALDLTRQSQNSGKDLHVTLAEYQILQNIYIAALLNTQQTVRAKSYLLQQLKKEQADGIKFKDHQTLANNILLNLGIMDTRLGNYVAAIQWFKQVVSLDPSQADLVSLLIATIYDYQAQYNNSILYATKVSHDKYLINIANVMLLNDYYALHDIIKVDALLNGIAINQKLSNIQAILFKVAYYSDVENYQKAYDILSANLSYINKNSKEYPNYLYQYAVSSAMLQKTNLAISLYKQYIKLVPKSPYGYNDLAYVYSNQTSDYKLALKYANIATNIAPLDSNILDTLGWVYYKLGQYEKAYLYIKNSYDIMQNPTVAEHLRNVLIALHKPESAKQIVIINKPDGLNKLKVELINRILNILMYMNYGVEVKR